MVSESFGQETSALTVALPGTSSRCRPHAQAEFQRVAFRRPINRWDAIAALSPGLRISNRARRT